MSKMSKMKVKKNILSFLDLRNSSSFFIYHITRYIILIAIINDLNDFKAISFYKTISEKNIYIRICRKRKKETIKDKILTFLIKDILMYNAN